MRNATLKSLFAVYKVSKYVKNKHNVIPIIWDDMLRQFSPEMMKKYEFNKIGVEIMIWTYIDGKVYICVLLRHIFTVLFL